MTQIDRRRRNRALGRKRDHTRDPEILDAALDVLAETGYDGMTIDMVAARAKAGKATLYRRWASKPELVLDAVACMKAKDLELDALPDTGTLRGDLVAMVKTPTIQRGRAQAQDHGGYRLDDRARPRARGRRAGGARRTARRCQPPGVPARDRARRDPG